MYRRLVRPLLFRADPERVHEATVRVAGAVGGARRVLGGPPSDPRLAVTVAGVRFPSPLGLAAGFDKSARAVPALSALGFGHVEIGSVSVDPSAGNPRPRLFRVPAERAIVVNYGVPNDGASVVAARLAAAAAAVPVGVNVVSTNRGGGEPESDEAVIGDYVAAVRRLESSGAYVCLNLSCPNTRDGRGFFADRARLRALLDALGAVARPLFIKVAPFEGPADLDSLLGAVAGSPVAGFSVNLAPGNPFGLPGAVSGPPCAAAAERTVAELYRAGGYPVIGSGGVFTAADAYRMVRRGASLVQLYTALVYEGPGVVPRITRGLSDLLARDGLSSVSEAVGVDA